MGILLVFIMIGGLAALCWLLYHVGIETGRKEVATGEVIMHLVEFENGERNWYPENELKNLSKHTIVK